MISSLVSGGSSPPLIAPMTHQPSSSAISVNSRKTSVRSTVCFHHQNSSGVGDPPEIKNHITLNPKNFNFRKSVMKVEKESEQVESVVGLKQMLSFCGLGYWVSGFRCFPWLALNIHMAQNLNMHPSTLQMVQNAGNLPMVAKPLYGVLSDALYICGEHRIPYVCIGVLLQILAWTPLALIPDAGSSLIPLMALVLLSNLGAAITEVAKDALVAEYGTTQKITGLQSYAFMASAVGGILGNLIGGFCLLKTQPRTMFLVFSSLLSLQLIASVTTKETSLGLRKPTEAHEVSNSVTENIRRQFSDFSVAIKDERISQPLIWIAGSIAIIPILSGTIFCYQTQCLHINPSVLGMSKVIGQVLLLSLTVLYDRRLKNLSMRKLVSVLQFTYALALLLDLILVKQINIKMGCEGSLTSFMASVLMLASIFSGFLGVGLSNVIGISSGDYSNLSIGIVIQAFAALVPLLWINQVPILQPVAVALRMFSGCIGGEASNACTCCYGAVCNCSSVTSKSGNKSSSSSAICRHQFRVATRALFMNVEFSNHESLPSLFDSYSELIRLYPSYPESKMVDKIRDEEYFHLTKSKKVCLDYNGIGLFSYSQVYNQELVPMAESSSVSSDSSYLRMPIFNVSYKATSLKIQLLHRGKESVVESAIRMRIMDYLGILEDEYSMVFTANRASAFKLVAESYPFRSSTKLLTIYEFPLQSRVTGSRYPCLWMGIAKENGWHVVFDACALGPKEMKSFGISLCQPDFIICSFYKIFGDNPSGFGCLFVKKSTIPILETITTFCIVSLVPPPKTLVNKNGEPCNINKDFQSISRYALQEDDEDTSCSFSGPIISSATQSVKHEVADNEQQDALHTKEIEEVEKQPIFTSEAIASSSNNESGRFHCKGLDHVDSLGLRMIASRARYLINWLVTALRTLHHPNTEPKIPLVRIYGPRIKFDRSPALAFNIFDWNGTKVEPNLVQKLADRSNISISYASLQHIWFSDKHRNEKERIHEEEQTKKQDTDTGKIKNEKDNGITVITVALGFLTNFEDTYRLWAFVAQFLNADFVEKER